MSRKVHLTGSTGRRSSETPTRHGVGHVYRPRFPFRAPLTLAAAEILLLFTIRTLMSVEA